MGRRHWLADAGLTMWRDIWAELTEQDGFKHDWYGELTNQMSHTFLGLSLAFLAVVAWAVIGGAMPDRLLTFAVISGGYAVFEVYQKWKPGDSWADWFMVSTGAGAVLLPFREITMEGAIAVLAFDYRTAALLFVVWATVLTCRVLARYQRPEAGGATPTPGLITTSDDGEAMTATSELHARHESQGAAMIVLRRIRDGITGHFSHRASEWLMIWPCLGMAVALWAQPGMFGVSPSFAQLSAWASEEQWSWLVLGCAILRGAALTVNGTFSGFRYSPHLRMFVAFVSALFWFQFTSGFFTAFIVGSGALSAVVAYSTFVLAEFLNIYRSSLDLGRARR